MDASARITRWLSAVVDLLAEPRLDMPIAQIQRMLHDTFDATAVSWNWRDSAIAHGLQMDPPEILQREQEMWQVWQAGGLMDCHALLVWHTETRNLAPQTMARVPSQVVPWQDRQVVEAPLARIESEQQMALNYRLDGLQHRSFVLGRHRLDFTDDDLLVAGFVQKSLVSLDRQVQALNKLVDPSGTAAAVDVGLTGRELAVLNLIADGDSTRQASRRLGCSPRTVDKHLEHAYRKLGVADRLNAVRVAREAGLLTTAPHAASLIPLHPSADQVRRLAEGA